MDKLLKAQRNEITEYHIYKRLSEKSKGKNKNTLMNIANSELDHYKILKKYTKKDIKPDRMKIASTLSNARLFGLTFAIKFMENGEKKAQINYEKFRIKEAKTFKANENRHEKLLIGLIDEQRLNYVSSIVLGLNDALVELTSALAGFTLAIQNTKLIAISGLILGIAAALSMGASGYLEVKAEKDSKKNPLTSLLYTGGAYILAVLALVAPYFIFTNIYESLVSTLVIAVSIIAGFTYYVSVAKDVSFKKKFLEMAAISLGIAGFTFLLGYIMNIAFGIQV